MYIIRVSAVPLVSPLERMTRFVVVRAFPVSPSHPSP